ncbi:hypothetical protein HY480_02210 [Candidatus Uhrbacteria bacterium]|nr:hypothetical protein [Candidatus Uhrbacteria bacterium]
MAIAAVTDELMERLGAGDLDPDLRAQLDDPEFLKNLAAHPGSQIAGMGSRIATARALQMAWAAVLTGGAVIGGILGLLYLNFHFVVVHFAHVRGFAPFGSEFRMWRTILGWPSFGLQFAEIIGLIVIDAFVALALLTAIVIVYIIVLGMTNYCAMAQQFGTIVAAAFFIFSAGGNLLGCLAPS